MYLDCLKTNQEASVAEAQPGKNVKPIAGAKSHRVSNEVMTWVVLGGKNGIAEGML